MSAVYSPGAIDRARDGAMEWLRENRDGYPLSWKQENAHTKRRGYLMYETDFEAPPIAGYEALEAEGIVERLDTVVIRSGEEREHFRLVTADA